MQKNFISMTNFAIVLAALLMLLTPSGVSAQELPGVYGITTQHPLNTLLVPVTPQERWNVLYQQPAQSPLVAGIQFDPNLHVYVTQVDTNLIKPSVASTSAAEATESAEVATPSAEVKGAAVDLEAEEAETATESAVITINKFGPEEEPETTPEAAVEPEITPAPVAPKPVTLEPSALDGLFEKYGTEYGLSPTMLKHIAKCESGLRPEALSSNGLYGGLFQFVSPTWSSNRKAMGLDPDPALRFNAEEAIKTAAFKISRDGIGAWPVCGRKATAAATVASI